MPPVQWTGGHGTVGGSGVLYPAGGAAAETYTGLLAANAAPSRRLMGVLVNDWSNAENARVKIYSADDGTTVLANIRIYFEVEPPTLPRYFDFGPGLFFNQPWVYELWCDTGEFDAMLLFQDT